MPIMTNSIQGDVLRTKETLKYILRDLDWKMKNKGKMNGLSTGYTELDSILGGVTNEQRCFLEYLRYSFGML